MEDENKKDDMVNTPEVLESKEPLAEGDTISPTKETVSAQPQKGKNNIKLAAALLIGAMVAAGLVWYFNTNSASSMSGNTGMTKHDAEYVLATVNGEEIYQKDLDQRIEEAAPQLQAQGVDMSDVVARAEIESQLLDDIIGYKLLVQASTDANIEVDTQEVDTLLQGYIEQSGDEEAFTAELAKINMTQDSFRDRVAEQLKLQKFISQNVEQTEVSDEDITAFYNTVVATQEGAPALSEIREQIAAQLSSDTQQQGVVAFVKSLRDNADVVVN